MIPKGQIVKCYYCGEELYQFPSRIKRAIKRKSKFYCNWECKSLAYKGQHISPATEFKKGEESYNWKGGICDNKEYLQYLKHKRRYLKIIGKFTFQEWKDLKEKYNHTCPCCKREEPEIKLTVDHIIPISKDGTNWISNIQPLCGSCNSKKFDKIKVYENM